MNARVALACVLGAVAVAASVAGVAGMVMIVDEAVTAVPPTITAPSSVVPSFVSSPDDLMPPGAVSASVARDLLETLPRAEPRGDLARYERSAFGRGWADPEHNGCDARQDALALWLKVQVKRGSCLSGGDIVDPYTGRVLLAPGEVDLDHVVPLAEAWRSGADRWSPDKRVAFANDPGHLVPTSAWANRSKADKPPQSWMPPLETYWCEYARVYVGTKHAYSLTVTVEEASTLRSALDTCAASARPDPS